MSKLESQSKSVEQLQADFVEAVRILKAIHEELTQAQWLLEYERAEASASQKESLV